MHVPLIAIFVSFCAGVIAGGSLSFPVHWLFVSGIVAALAVKSGKDWFTALAAQLTFLFLIGCQARILTDVRYENQLRDWVRIHEQETVRLQGTAVRTPEIGDDFYVLRLRVSTVAGLPLDGSVRLTVAGKTVRFPVVGDVVETYSKLRLPVRFRAEGTFDYERYLKKEGIHVLGSVKDPDLIRIIGHRRSLRSYLSSLRLQLIQQTARNFNPEHAGILRALWLDDRSGLSGSTEQIMINAGIFHVIAISGFHVAVILLLCFFMLKYFLRFRLALLLLVFFLFFYFLLLEGRSSITRSFLMFLVVAFSYFWQEQIKWRSALSLSALAQVVINPYELFDPGYHLTYLSTAAILFIGAPLCKYVRFPRRIYQYAFNFLIISVSVQLVLTPYQAFVFHKVPYASIFANFVAIPISSLLIASGMIFMPFPFLQAYLSSFLRRMLSGFIDSSTLFSETGPLVVASVPLWLTVTFYLLFLGAIFLRRKTLCAACLVLGACAFVWIVSPVPGANKDFLRFHFIDVGQGDAILLEYPDGSHDLVDGGGFWNPEAFDIGEAVLLPYLTSRGVTKLHRVFLTHAHADHMNGLVSLLRYIPAREIYVTRQPLAEAGYQRLLSSLSQDVRPVRRGHRWKQGDVTLQVLAPADARKTLKVANDDSMVLLVEYQNRKILLMGDAEAETERQLAAISALKVDYIKVPHHGSKTSSTPLLLDKIRPKIAFLTAGKGNWFGHPHPDVVQNYRSRHVVLHRTDREGTLRLTIRKGYPYIETFE